jgi:hypothetical protein
MKLAAGDSMIESDCPRAERSADDTIFTGLKIAAPGSALAGRSRRRHANIDAADNPRSRQYADTGKPLSRCCSINFRQRVVESSFLGF